MAEKKKERAFIAVTLPKPLREKFNHISSTISKDFKDVRAIPAENIHLTLKFLGDRTLEEIESITNKLSKLSGDIDLFESKICKTVDAFPSTRGAKVLVFKFCSAKKGIEYIYKRIENSLVDIGIKKDKRRFIPHVTIARTKKITDISIYKDNDFFETEQKVPISNITFYKSTLLNTGAEYSIIARFDLK